MKKLLNLPEKSFSYIHIMPDSIYSIDFKHAIEKFYNLEEHFFLIREYEGKRDYGENSVVMYRFTAEVYRWLRKYGGHAKEILFHYLPTDWDMQLFFALSSLNRKTVFCWYIWSADLYEVYQAEKEIKGLAIKRRFKRFCRKKWIDKIQRIIVFVKGDFDKAVEFYGVQVKMFQAEYRYHLIQPVTVPPHEGIRILAGHEASTALLHRAMFQRIKSCDAPDIQVYSIFSYGGSEEYCGEMIRYGKELFGERFFPLTEYMKYDEYIAFLNSADVFLNEADVQCAAGNIVNMLYLGKKVYLSKLNPILGYMQSLGAVIFDKEDFASTYHIPLTLREKDINRQVMQNLVSDETFKSKWDQIFSVE